MPFTKDGKRRELMTPERSRIVEAHNRGASWREIEKDFPITARGAKKVYDRWKETNSLRRTKHQGRHKKLSRSDERYLLQLATRFPQATIAEITSQSGLTALHDDIYVPMYDDLGPPIKPVILPQPSLKIQRLLASGQPLHQLHTLN
ncbi:hypothetical protein HOY82DRAFT_603209 [Tuber indicum]|nr:hypothetical protein HOY82DRAFT_603209 [Tuber indicum]